MSQNLEKVNGSVESNTEVLLFYSVAFFGIYYA